MNLFLIFIPYKEMGEAVKNVLASQLDGNTQSDITSMLIAG